MGDRRAHARLQEWFLAAFCEDFEAHGASVIARVRQSQPSDYLKAASGCPIVAPSGNQTDADRVAQGHEPEPIMLDLMNPVGAGRGLVGCGWQAGFDEARPFGGKDSGALTRRGAHRSGCGEGPT